MERIKLKALLNDMTLEEKALQLVQLYGAFLGDVDVLTGPAMSFAKMPADRPYQVGSLLGEHGAEHLIDLQDKMMAIQPHHIPALFMLDVIHGYKTGFPVPIAIGSSFNPSLAKEICSAAGKEAAVAGLHVTFSPMVDLVRDSRWGRVMESTGEDVWLNCQMAKAEVEGFQGDDFKDKGKLAACVKHFAAYGAAVAGRDYNVTEISEHTLHEDYLPSYKAAVDAGVALVMTAFNTIDRKPCTTNKKLLRDILRDEMGFKGVVISDYGAIQETIAHTTSVDHRDAAKKAILAGCDIDMVSPCYIQNLVSLVEDGEVDIKLVDEAVMRVLELKNDLGLFENPYKDASSEGEKEVLMCREHLELSRRAAEETTVLLKNDGALPLKKNQKIVVVGALADDNLITGSWALFVDKDKTVTLKQAISELYSDVNVSFFASDEISDEMLEAAESADVVLLALGENHTKTGESLSIADITLCKAHRDLFDAVYKVNKNTVTVLFGGRPLALPEVAQKTNALLEAWLPGTCGAYAVADILFGDANPSGRLSMSFPYTTGQLPISYAAFTTGRPKPNTDKFVPYASNYMDYPNVPLYPFGWGLSYTNVEYSGVSLSADKLTKDGKIFASVTVKNAGDMAVLEPVQLYIRDIKGSVVRPVRELKGIEKISLEAGEEKTVSFEITEPMLRFYDDEMNFVSEKGEFMAWIGSTSLTENGAKFVLE
ncbi:MAG: glycoside hydrolase family 3 C-terminal domain-containing protein [Oscillospiraceae bacterium]|nr:glycoside hydrolase family 3 C-terminal domain-containing protein [Oscillospiraceae bacterium]